MTGYRPFTDRKTGLYPYSSTLVNLPSLLAEQVISWGEAMIPEQNIYCPPMDFIHGREDEVHITILYGIHSQSHEAVQSVLQQQEPFEIRLGHVSVFTNNSDFDVVKIEAFSPSLFYFNHLLKNTVPNTPNYTTYRPHVTIAYIKKDSANKEIVGSDYFKDWQWRASTIIFSSKNGIKTPIRLNTLQPAYS